MRTIYYISQSPTWAGRKEILLIFHLGCAISIWFQYLLISNIHKYLMSMRNIYSISQSPTWAGREEILIIFNLGCAMPKIYGEGRGFHPWTILFTSVRLIWMIKIFGEKISNWTTPLQQTSSSKWSASFAKQSILLSFLQQSGSSRSGSFANQVMLDCPSGWFGSLEKYHTGIPHICQFWGTTTPLRPVKGTPKSA